jgi:hypothetical protein
MVFDILDLHENWGWLMKSRIPIGQFEPDDDSNFSRRTTLTRLARIAKACGAIALFGVSSEKAYASGNIGTYQGSPPNVNFDGHK